MWGSCVVIPAPDRKKLLQELHIGPEDIVKGCNECQLTRAAPALPWPSKPWSHIHMDYAGPFLDHMFLVIIDAGSKWIEVFPVHSSTAKITI